MRIKVIIIGAGIIGSSISRVLSMYENLEVHLVEKEADVGWGVSKATTAIIHPGHEEDFEKHPLRAKLCAEGNRLWRRWTRELDIPVRWPGELMIALDDRELKNAERYLEYAEKNGVPEVRLINRDEMLKLEPNANPDAAGALWAPTAGVINPVKAVIALVENSIDNGVKLHTESRVLDVKVEDYQVKGVLTSRGFLEADIVNNAAGLYSDLVSRMAGIDEFAIYPRRGEYCIFDEKAYPKVTRILHPVPTEITKGVYVVTTPENNLLVGPTAEDLPKDAREDNSTSKEGLSFVLEQAERITRTLPPKSKVIRTFAGLRPEPPMGRWIIKFYEDPWGFINVAGIRSPGLASAPAIAQYIVKLIRNGLDVKLVKKRRWLPYRRSIVSFKDLNRREQNRLIKRDPSYGNVVCMCRMVTEAEILEAIRRMRKIGVKTITLDGVKFRTFALTGLCQGSYCRLRIARIIVRELGVPLWRVTLRGEGTDYGIGDVKALLKENNFYEE